MSAQQSPHWTFQLAQAPARRRQLHSQARLELHSRRGSLQRSSLRDVQQCKSETNRSEGMHKQTDREEDANATTMPKSTTSTSPK
eukprot:5495969-Amphidinium_carterae.1